MEIIRRSSTSEKTETHIPELCIEAVLRAVPRRFLPAVEAAIRRGGEDGAEELRFRVNRPVQLVTARGEVMLLQYAPFTQKEAAAMLEAVCGYSVYAKEQQLIRGFITLPGGARIGLSGEPLLGKDGIERFTNVSGFDIRLPREIIGCAEAFLPMLTENLPSGRLPVSALIAGKPGVGKTTFLRDCARCCSDGVGIARPLKVSLADERNELSGSIEGVPALNVGLRTDVITSVPKTVSIPMLLRSMAPDVIVTDEIGGADDMRAVSEATKYGVTVLASIHAGSSAELAHKKWLVDALSEGSFIRVLLLARNGGRFYLRSAALTEIYHGARGC